MSISCVKFSDRISGHQYFMNEISSDLSCYLNGTDHIIKAVIKRFLKQPSNSFDTHLFMHSIFDKFEFDGKIIFKRGSIWNDFELISMIVFIKI